MLAIVVAQCEVHGLDPAEIVGIERVLPADHCLRWYLQIGLERLNDGPKHGHAGETKLSATALQYLSEVGIHKREQHNPGRCFDMAQDR